MLVQEKVTKENTPSRPRSPGFLPGDFARALRRFADGTSLCRQRTRAHRARAPAGFFLRVLAAAEREPGRSRARPSWPQKPRSERRTPTSVIPAKAGIHFCCCFGFAFDVGPCGAAKGGRIRPAHRAGRREGSRRFCRRPGWPVGKTPAARSEPARSAGVPPGCPLFGYFLWASRESDPAARMADGTPQGRESVFASTPKDKSKWIPAFAGMTK